MSYALVSIFALGKVSCHNSGNVIEYHQFYRASSLRASEMPEFRSDQCFGKISHGESSPTRIGSIP